MFYMQKFQNKKLIFKPNNFNFLNSMYLFIRKLYNITYKFN